MQTLNKFKNKLEKESLNYEEQINHLKSRISELEQFIGQYQIPCGPSSDQTAPGVNVPAFPSSFEPLNSHEEGAPPPPPPPPLSGVPPPPPPPPSGLLGCGPVRNKNLPQPSQPLKSFNWTKLPENKIQGTIWTEIDDLKVSATKSMKVKGDKKRIRVIGELCI